MVDSLVGRTVGKYKIVEHLGRGGMAEVYKAHQEALDRYVAIKLMHSFLSDDQEFLGRFKREAKNMAALNHPGIVSVYDFDVQGQTYYIVMEFVSGGTLKEKLEGIAARGEQLPLSQTVRLILEIAEALSYAHNRGMIHRDIKPANIMLDEDGKAVLTDFGIAKMLSGPSYTATGAMIGTPAYMSPEQGLGQPGDERSDLYSLGVLFFQMATGRLPYDADTPLAVVLKHINEPVPMPFSLNPNLPAGIHDTIIKSMAKAPEERFQTAHEMARAIREAVQSDDLSWVTTLPADLLQDKPTPAPLSTRAGLTHARPTDATRIAPVAGAGQAGAGHTEIVTPLVRDAKAQPASNSGQESKPARPWLWFAAAGVAIMLLLSVVAGGIALAGWGNDVTPTVMALVENTATATLSPLTDTPEPTPTEIDIVAQVNAALTAAAAANPTATPTLTPSATPTATQTPNATSTFLASCVRDVELVVAHTYANQSFYSAPVRADFPLSWVLKNSGDCPWPASLLWTYQDGEAFSQRGPVSLASGVSPNGEVTVQANLVAPATAGTYETTWQLVDADGNAFGPEVMVEILVYVPATPTAVPPTATAPLQTATPAQTVAVGFNIFFDRGCEYPGGGPEWRCNMLITPFGGGGGPYTIWVFDGPSPAEYRGGNATHFISKARCHPWNHEIKVQDDASGQSFSRAFFIDPTTLSTFPSGGCTLP